MISVQRNVIALVLALLVTSVGLVDAAIGRQGDLVAIFGLAGALQLVALAGLRAGHRPVRLRPDLSAWVDEHAAATGEPAQRLADRCVAAYRAGLTADRGERP
jgi:hypothetical protein